MSYEDDYETRTPNLTKTNTLLEELRDSAQGDREEAEHRLHATRPLPDAFDVGRYLDASRRLGVAHVALMNTQQGDWWKSSPAIGDLLYRDTALHSEGTGHTFAGRAEQLAEDTAAELTYLATMIADAVTRTPKSNTKAHASLRSLGLATVAAMALFTVAKNDPAELERMLLGLYRVGYDVENDIVTMDGKPAPGEEA